MIAARRRRLTLLLRDLAAASAFGSMAISGQLPLWGMAIYGVALALALFDRRVLSGRGLLTALVLAGAGIALYTLVAAGSLDLVLAACTFAGFISAQRLLAPPTPQLDAQVHLTSLLMIAGGAALSADLLFALTLVAFCVTATFSLGFSVVEESLPEGADFPLRPLAGRLAVGALAALLGAAVFFFAFPRLSWNLVGRKVSPSWGAPTTGMSDRVSLGGDGSIKRNPRVVLRATLEPDPRVDALDGYWLGTAFDTFTGTEWVGNTQLGPPQQQIELARRPAKTVHQRIELLPSYGSRVLVALDTPTLLANATAHGTSYSSRVGLQEVKGQEVRFSEGAISYTYHAFSAAPDAPGGDPGHDPQRYLGLPPTLDARVKALAERVVGADREPLAAARKLQSFLQSDYGYTLELSPSDDPLADFLFVRKEGHCEHFATALAVMLRSLEIPARVAGGFFGGERVGKQYVVRAGDAHAWTQVLVPGRGFVTVDATPPAHRVAQADTVFAALVRLYETVEEWWRSAVVDYSFIDQARFARDLIRPPRNAPESQAGPRSLAPWMIAAAVALVAYAFWRFPRRQRTAAERTEATLLLEGLERLLARHQLRVEAGEGIEELSSRLEAQAHPLAPTVQRATRRYLEARFGTRPLSPGERQHWLDTVARAAQQVEKTYLPKSA